MYKLKLRAAQHLFPTVALEYWREKDSLGQKTASEGSSSSTIK